MLIDQKPLLGFKDVLIEPRITPIRSRSEVTLERTFEFNNGKMLTCVPICAANMDTVGTFRMASTICNDGCITAIHKHYTIEQWRNSKIIQHRKALNHSAITIGMEDSFDRFKEINDFTENECSLVCIDVANGYMTSFYNYVRKFKKEFPDKIVIAGNVATESGAKQLADAGADIIKVGIGSGSVCTTRFKTGIGIPQISAIQSCLDGIGPNQYLMSDGGCNGSGDIAKAFVAGADFVMLGGMLANHMESYCIDGFYGMSSMTAQKKYNGGKQNHRGSEGKHINIPHRGAVKDTIHDIFGGLRSCGAYIGERKLENFHYANLVRVTEQTNDIYGSPWQSQNTT